MLNHLRTFSKKFILILNFYHIEMGNVFTSPGIPLVGNLRTRLLALHVLEAVLPACESGVEDDQMAQVYIFKVSRFFFSFLLCDSPRI